MKNKYIILLFIATLFMSIGYATVNNVTLNFDGSVSVNSFTGILITDVEYNSSLSNVSTNNSIIIDSVQTMLHSKIELEDNSSSRVTYTVTIYNNTNKNYIFDEALFDEENGNFYDNENIEFSLSGISHGTKLKSKHSITFNITFNYKNGFTPSAEDETDNILNSYINFKFTEEVLEWYEQCKSYSTDLKCKIIAASDPQSDEDINFTANSSTTNGLGMYYISDTNKTEDLDGDGTGDKVFYYRGLVTDNFVIFDSYCWRIVKINEDKTIKLIYAGTPTNGTCPANGSTNVYISSSRYNTSANNNAYVGYMYGSGNSYNAAHANTNSSTIKETIDEWYQTNLSDSAEFLADYRFCVDRSLTSGNGYGTSTSYYAPGTRFVTNTNNQLPTNICPQDNDKFTVSAENGNGALTYPIGLLTADEANYAGIRYYTRNTRNTNSYLYSANNFWLMSPAYYNNNAYVFYVNNYGNMRVQTTSSNTTTYIRPVINLLSTVSYESGSGTNTDPYIVNGTVNPDEPIVEPEESENWYENCEFLAYEDRLNCKMLNTSTASSDSSINFGAMASNTNGNGLYYTSDSSKTEDLDGDGSGERVYYYRGAVTDNYVSFGGFCWRIVRTNEDESVKLIYGGVLNNGSCPQTGSRINIGTSSFNTRSNDNAYVGYMYGTTGANNYNATHSNTNNSTIKGVIDNWYSSNLSSYSSFLSDTPFCNDRSIYSGNGYATNVTSYNPYNRLFTNKAPTLKCAQNNDKFTVGNTGNGALTYPIGLLTADEVEYAGSMQNSNNSQTTYYLYTANAMWTMTPSDYYNDNGDVSGYVFYINTNGAMRLTNDLSTSYDVRPVINIKNTVEVSGGSGTYNDPFTLINN